MDLADVLIEARAYVARPGNDFSWSSWEDSTDALAELDRLISSARDRHIDTRTAGAVFAPTGPMHELALSSGWADDFLTLAGRWDTLTGTPAHAGRIECARCDRPADGIELIGPDPHAELRRTSFTGVLTRPLSVDAFHRIAALLRPPDPAGLYALDPELVPCWCPPCSAAYCSAHWRTWDVFDDDGFHDSIRGTCPAGHERMLED